MNTVATSESEIGTEHDFVLDLDESADAEVVAKMGQGEVARVGSDFADVVEGGNSKERPDMMVEFGLQ